MELIKKGMINVIYGAPGVGKTTLAIQQLPEATIFDTEGGVSKERLDQLKLTPKLINVLTWKQQTSLPRHIHKFKDIIIDSITNNYKTQICLENKRNVDSALYVQLNYLEKHARDNNVAIIITAQTYNRENEKMFCNDIIRSKSKVILKLQKEKLIIEKHPETLKEVQFKIEKEGIVFK